MKFRPITIVLTLSMLCIPAVAGAEAELAKESVLVRWHDQALTVRDLDAAVASAPSHIQADLVGNAKQLSKLLENMQLNKTLANKAREIGLDKDPDVQARLRMEQEKDLAAFYLKRFEETLPLPDFAVVAREQYKVNTDRFKVPASVRASHILIRAKDRTQDEARQLAEEVRAKALAGEPFDKLADTYSEDPSAEINHGDLGRFSKGRMVPEFSDAAFALKNPGDISEVVKTKFGYHVIRLAERTDERIKSYEEVASQLLEEAKQKYIGERKLEYVSTIKNDPTIKIDEALFKAYIDQGKQKNPTPSGPSRN